jgi:GT2 family glycosyltransferase
MAHLGRLRPAPEISRRRSPSAHQCIPKLSVVIVNYRQWHNTAQLVRQLRACRSMRRQEAEVVVVDNHSPPHPLIHGLRRWPGVSLRRWGRNRGFARAVNEGCRLSRGDWILLLNPDMSVTPEFLEGVVALAARLTDTEPRTGIVGFQLRNGDGSRQLSVGVFPSLAGTLAGLVLPRARRKYQALVPDARCQVPWVTGCCLLLRRDCLRDVGGFDERFFLYYEDVDLCRRARDRGWTVCHEPGLQATHLSPVHERKVPPALRVITRHGLLTYTRQHWPRWQCRLLGGIIRLEAWLRGLGARWRGDVEAAAMFEQLATLTVAITRGNPHDARRRLERAIRRL